MRAVIVVVALAWCASGARAERPSPFERLKALVGEWEAEVDSGKRVRVSYRLIAGDTVLVQSFKPPSGRETLTVIHPDGERLIATHYCAQGNQPRLRLDAAASTEERAVFRFADATNLARPTASHLDRLELRLEGDSRYTEIETYVEEGKPDVTTLRFRRVR